MGTIEKEPSELDYEFGRWTTARLAIYLEEKTGIKLNEFVKNEWISAGNLESTFSDNGPLILIILDNASYHKKKIIVEAIEKELPNIQLYFLPAYSPDMNLVELVWHSEDRIYSSQII